MKVTVIGEQIPQEEIDAFNDGKRAEVEDRVKHTV